MIFDHIKNREVYLQNPVFEKVFTIIETPEYLRNDGNIFKVNEDLFIKRVQYTTINSDWITEAHLKYVDIQMIITGSEMIKVYNTDDLLATTPYGETEDVRFYDTLDALSKRSSDLVLRPGYFAVLMPQDAHMTQIAFEEQPAWVEKIVIKAHKKYFNLLN